MKNDDFIKLGYLAIQKGDFQEAINIFKKALMIKKNEQAFTGIGLANFYLENYSTAYWALNKALEYNPKLEEALNILNQIEYKLKNVSKKILNHRVNFRTNGDFIEILKNDKWFKFLIKGINLGLALPGFYPGEYPIKKKTYLKWFELIFKMGLNTVRVYTIQSPNFYEAFYEFNKDEPKIFLIQGIWYEPPDDSDFNNNKFINYIKENIREAVDAIHGNIELYEKPGKPFGKYLCDVSPCLLGYLFGREPEACLVKNFNEKNRRKIEDYQGKFLSIKEGSPFETWNAKILDYLVDYEFSKYNKISLVSIVNWPTLDPLIHPSESDTEKEEAYFFGTTIHQSKVCNENEDMEVFDTFKIKSRYDCFFSSYHIYPYYPDFMINDYINESEPYLSYLKNLKNHYNNHPIVVAEFGIPTSRISAHWHHKGWTHGGINDKEQGQIIIKMFDNIINSKCAGGIIFSLFDEWFKFNWIFSEFYISSERRHYWFNLQDPEKNYGLLEIYPGYPGKKITLQGKYEEWNKATLMYEKNNGPLYHIEDGSDGSRDIKKLSITHDEGFIYISLITSGKINFDLSNYLIGLDTGESTIGEYSLPFGINIESPVGLKFLIHLCGINESRILVQSNYMKFIDNSSIYISTKKNIHPIKSLLGCWIPIILKNNRRRISKNLKEFYPPHHYVVSKLRFGSLNSNHPDYDNLSDFYVKDNIIEIRLPWELINFTDPSSKQILWKDGKTKTKESDGIRVIALSYKPHPLYKPLALKLADVIPQPLKKDYIKTYSWEKWDYPLYHVAPKKSYYILKEYFKNEKN